MTLEKYLRETEHEQTHRIDSHFSILLESIKNYTGNNPIGHQNSNLKASEDIRNFRFL